MKYYEYVPCKDAKYSFDGDIDDLRVLCWRVLAFHALVNYNGIDRQSGLRLLLVRIDELIDNLKARVKRGDNTLGWALQKTHELRHIVLDMIQNGHSINLNASKCESGLKSWGKGPGKNAWKRGNELFNKSAANKLHEQQLIGKVVYATETYVSGKQQQQEEDVVITLAGRRILLEEGGGWRFAGNTRVTKTANMVDSVLATFLTDKYHCEIMLYSEARLPAEDSSVDETILVRGTSHYREHTGEWYDWVEVSYQQTKDAGRTSYTMGYPFQIRGFFHDPATGKATAVGYCALVQSDNEIFESKGLVEHWRMEDFLRVIPCECIVQLIFGFYLPKEAMVTESSDKEGRSNSKKRKAFVIKDRKLEWGTLFMEGWNEDKVRTTPVHRRRKRKSDKQHA